MKNKERHVSVVLLWLPDFQRHLDEALQLANITLRLTGALGKRTKFQQDSTAQLVLEVATTGSEGDPEKEKINGKPAHLPKV